MKFQAGDLIMHRYWDDVCLERRLDPNDKDTSVDNLNQKSYSYFEGKIYRVVSTRKRSMNLERNGREYLEDNDSLYILIKRRGTPRKMTIRAIEELAGFAIEIIDYEEE